MGGEGRRDARRLGHGGRRLRDDGDGAGISASRSWSRTGDAGSARRCSSERWLISKTRLGSRRAPPKRAAASPSGTASGRRIPVASPASIRVPSTRASSTRPRRGSRRCCEVGPEQIFDVDAESVLDEPGTTRSTRSSTTSGSCDYWEHPDLDLELSQAAVVDGRAVAVAYVMVDRRVTPGAQRLHRLAPRLSRPRVRPARQARL